MRPPQQLVAASGVNISGANAASYTINTVSATDAGSYDVIATGSCGSVTSSAATLTVNTAPAVTASPQNITLCAGSNHTFNVTGTTDSNTLRALKQLYTFITRSRYGSVLIDHDLTKLVGTSVLDSYKGNAVVPKADGFLDIYRAHIQTVNNLTEEK